MYKLKAEFTELFKEIRTSAYVNYMDCELTYMSAIVNGRKSCSTLFAKSIIAVRFDIGIKDEQMNEMLEKYFIKEK